MVRTSVYNSLSPPHYPVNYFVVYGILLCKGEYNNRGWILRWLSWIRPIMAHIGCQRSRPSRAIETMAYACIPRFPLPWPLCGRAKPHGRGRPAIVLCDGFVYVFVFADMRAVQCIYSEQTGIYIFGDIWRATVKTPVFARLNQVESQGHIRRMQPGVRLWHLTLIFGLGYHFHGEAFFKFQLVSCCAVFCRRDFTGTEETTGKEGLLIVRPWQHFYIVS